MVAGSIVPNLVGATFCQFSLRDAAPVVDNQWPSCLHVLKIAVMIGEAKMSIQELCSPMLAAFASALGATPFGRRRRR
jgi:hypothetical protein